MRHITCFLAIAEVESVSEAAEHLGLTQPAMSKTLRELEEILGRQLFDRAGRRLHLNAEGRIYQGHASAALLELMRGQSRIRGNTTGSRLKVGVLPTAASDLFPRAALKYRAENPKARLSVMTGPNWLLFDMLREGRLDMVVGRMPETEALSGLTFQQLYVEDVVLVVRPGHPLTRTVRPAAQIADYPLVLPPGGAVIRKTVLRYLESIGLPEAEGAFETVSLTFGRKVVQESDMVWFISRGVVADELSNGTLVDIPLVSKLLAGPVGISQKESVPPSLERAALIAALRDVADGQQNHDTSPTGGQRDTQPAAK
ncbi:LysR substrate-binding domain-containing protein [Halovulum sp. GXIMD14794]